MSLIGHLGSRVGALARDVFGLRDSPVPLPGMLRNGFAIGAGFVTFVAAGQIEAAVVCAVFGNFLCFCDRARTLKARLWVQGVGAILCAAAGAVGSLIAGNDPLILVTTFALTLFAGFVHGTQPGVEAVPRFAIISFVAAAFLPVGHLGALVAALVATVFSIAAIVVDDHIRHGVRGVRIARINATVSYPGPRFSITYGSAAVCGLAIGLLWGQSRPYWVTITTLLVMQPDRRANTVRVLQRFVGTIFGVIAAFLITRIVPLSAGPSVYLIFALALPFVWPLGFERNYGLGVALLSTWVLLLIDFALPAEEVVVPVFLSRLSDTAIGCAVALVGSFIVYETREA